MIRFFVQKMIAAFANQQEIGQDLPATNSRNRVMRSIRINHLMLMRQVKGVNMFTLNNPNKTDDHQAYQVESLPCPHCNTTVTITITPQQLYAFNQGGKIQDVLPDVSLDVRERFMTGICGPCWNKIFPEE